MIGKCRLSETRRQRSRSNNNKKKKKKNKKNALENAVARAMLGAFLASNSPGPKWGPVFRAHLLRAVTWSRLALAVGLR